MNKQLRKFNQIPELTKIKELDRYDFANLFHIIEKNEKSYFNICDTIRIVNLDKISPDFYTVYEASDADSWASISFIFYKTVKLWWLICKFNNIKNPFVQLKGGDLIKVPDSRIVESILNTLRSDYVS
jgi:hypothetical protein